MYTVVRRRTVSFVDWIKRNMPTRSLVSWALCSIVLLGWGLRLYGLGRLSIWLDEGFTVYSARLDMGSMMRFLAAMEHPPLYFLLLHLWIRVAGNGAFVWRFLSVTAGTVSIVGTYLLARRLAGAWIGLTAALLVALSPYHIWHSRDVRMYELYFALSMISCYLFLRALETGSRRAWAGYVVSAVVGLYTLNMMVLVFLVQGTYGLFFVRKYVKRVRSLLVSLVVGCIGYAPWLPVLLVQAQHVGQYFWIPRPTWLTVRGTLLNFYSSFLFSNSPWHPSLGTWPESLVYLALPFGLLLGVMVLGRDRNWRALVFALLLLSVPIGLLFAVSQYRSAYLDRTVIAASGGLLLALAAGCSGFRGRWGRVAGIVLLLSIVGTNAVSLGRMYRSGEKEEWQQAAQLVSARVREGDLVLLDFGIGQIPFDLYYQESGPPVESHGYPLDVDHWRTQEPGLGTRWWILDIMRFDKVAADARVETLLADATRVWLVVNRPLGKSHLQQMLAEWSTGQPTSQEFNRVSVILYE